MTSKTRKNTQVLLLVVAVTGLALASFIPATTAHDDTDGSGGGPVDEHVLSRTFIDNAPGVRAVICSQTVAELLEIPGAGPKDPDEPDCDENNPNWLLGVNTGGFAASSFYYDLLRVRVASPDGLAPDTIEVDPHLKASFQVGTGISQSGLLGLGSPNNWNLHPNDLDGWNLAAVSHDDASLDFVPGVPNELFPLADADAIIGDFGPSLDATDFIVNFETNSFSTGFFRPNVEDVDRDGTSFVVSVVTINEVTEVVPSAANVQHTEDRIAGDSYLDSSDWFLALSLDDEGQWPAAIQTALDGGLHNNVGSDTQAGDRNPL